MNDTSQPKPSAQTAVAEITMSGTAGVRIGPLLNMAQPQAEAG